jgi:very-short-patch-repair endonuclease
MSEINETNVLLENIKERLSADTQLLLMPGSRISDVWEILIGSYMAKAIEIMSRSESPIEKIMAITLFHLFNVNRPRFRKWETKNYSQKTFDLDGKNYRTDFYFEAINLEGKEVLKLIIECDGYDFHEKTKEQAQKDKERDRIFTKNGFKILRFTGSEIYKDPLKCGLDVIKTVIEVYKNIEGE